VILALLCGFALAAAPVKGEQSTFSWDPKPTESAELALVLPATPASLSVEIPCQALRVGGFGRPASWVPFATGTPNADSTLMLEMLGNDLSVKFGSRYLTGLNAQVGQGKDCTTRLRYSNATGLVDFEPGIGVRSVSAPLQSPNSNAGRILPTPEFYVSALRTDPVLRGFISTQVTAQPSTIESGWWRWLISALGLASVLSAVMLARGVFPQRQEASSQNDGSARATPRWTGSDTFIAISGTLALVLIPPLYDDGWVLTTVRAFPNLGFFSNYYTAQAAAQPQGFWWNWLEQFWLTPLPTPVLMLRLPSVLIVVVTWWFLRRRVIDQITEPRRRVLVRGLVAMLASITLIAWAPTLRPEPLIGLLLAVSIAMVLEYTRQPRPWLLYAAGVVSALAMTTHQTGWLVLCANLAMVPKIASEFRTSRQPRPLTWHLCLAAGSSLAMVLLLTFVVVDFSVWNEARIAFTSGGLHDSTFNEGKRIGDLVAGETASSPRLLSAALLYLGAIAFLARPRRVAMSLQSSAGWAALAGFAGLALTSSKWLWHFGATGPMIVVLAAIGINGLLDKTGWRSVRIGIGSAALLIVGMIATHTPAAWGNFDLVSIDWFSPSTSLPGFLRWTSVSYWVIAGAAIAWFTWRLRKQGRGTTFPLIAATTITCATVAGVSVIPLVIDGINEPNVSWAGISGHSFATGACGIAGPQGLLIPTKTEPLALGFGPDDAPVKPTASFVGVGRVGAVSPLPGNPIWVPGPGLLGTASTPWYAVRPRSTMQTWFQGRGGATSVDIDWATPTGPQVQTINRNDVIESWDLLQFIPPEGATAFRVSWRTQDGPYAVAAPVAVTAGAPLTEVVGKSAVWNGPENHLLATCLPMPSIREGRVAQFAYSVDTPQIDGINAWSAVDVLTEVACYDLAARRRMCIYRVDQPGPSTIAVTTPTVTR